jgi:hypothetical protein
MMTCMDCHETSPPPHSVIPITFTLFHLVFLVAFNLSSHFTPCLPHEPWAILQSYLFTLKAYPSH